METPQFDLLPEDFAAALAFYNKDPERRRNGFFIRILFVFLFISHFALVPSAAAALLLVDRNPFDAIGLIIVGQIACWLGFFVAITMKIPTAKGRDRFDKTIRIAIDPEGLSYSDPLVVTTYRWSALEKIGATKDHVFFFASPTLARIVPRRAFADADTFVKFGDIARNYFQAAKTLEDNPSKGLT